ncbi:MAG: sulfotransferase [Candidatus Parcubacteria bacterium]|nr:sulfotransferase [Burkholderiales bacterium]
MAAPVTQLQFLVGIELGRLLTLLARHRVSRARLRPLGQLLSFGIVSSALSLFDTLRLRARLASVALSAPPIFVIGHWRSGTTLLHRLLARDPLLHSPTFFECFLPRGFVTGYPLLARHFGQYLPPTRVFDAVPLGVDEPFEEEFALLKMTLCSPMLEDVFPADAGRYGDDDGFDGSERAAQRWAAVLSDFSRRLTLQHGKRLLFKSPANTFRVPLLRNAFPGAKFIHVHRHPCEVVASTIRMRTVLRQHNALQDLPTPAPSPAAVVSRLARAHAASAEARASCDPREFCDVALDALQADPTGTVAKVYQQLGLPGFEAARPALLETLGRLGSERNAHQLEPELARRVGDECAPAFSYYGYDRPG